MALVENKKSEVMNKSEDKEEVFYRVYPDMRRKVNYEDKTVTLEISLPGVAKDKISLKALPTWFHIEARRDHLEYNANQSWGIEVVPNKTTAKYENGLLQITAYIKDPMEDAKTVAL